MNIEYNDHRILAIVLFWSKNWVGYYWNLVQYKD